MFGVVTLDNIVSAKPEDVFKLTEALSDIGGNPSAARAVLNALELKFWSSKTGILHHSDRVSCARNARLKEESIAYPALANRKVCSRCLGSLVGSLHPTARGSVAHTTEMDTSVRHILEALVSENLLSVAKPSVTAAVDHVRKYDAEAAKFFETKIAEKSGLTLGELFDHKPTMAECVVNKFGRTISGQSTLASGIPSSVVRALYLGEPVPAARGETAWDTAVEAVIEHVKTWNVARMLAVAPSEITGSAEELVHGLAVKVAQTIVELLDTICSGIRTQNMVYKNCYSYMLPYGEVDSAILFGVTSNLVFTDRDDDMEGFPLTPDTTIAELAEVALQIEKEENRGSRF